MHKWNKMKIKLRAAIPSGITRKILPAVSLEYGVFCKGIRAFARRL